MQGQDCLKDVYNILKSVKVVRKLKHSFRNCKSCQRTEFNYFNKKKNIYIYLFNILYFKKKMALLTTSTDYRGINNKIKTTEQPKKKLL